jgi:hypothetical protein
MDRLHAVPFRREFIEALACLAIMFQGSLQVLIELVLGQFRQKGSKSCFCITHKAVVNFGAPA